MPATHTHTHIERHTETHTEPHKELPAYWQRLSGKTQFRRQRQQIVRQSCSQLCQHHLKFPLPAAVSAPASASTSAASRAHTSKVDGEQSRAKRHRRRWRQRQRADVEAWATQSRLLPHSANVTSRPGTPFLQPYSSDFWLSAAAEPTPEQQRQTDEETGEQTKRQRDKA